MLLDSNIIIYAAKPEYTDLRRLIAEHAPAVSAISYVEALGYHKLTDNERQNLENFFETALILPLSDYVLAQSIRLRQQKKMSLGDALVGATALAFGLTLVTRNTDDFEWIEGLSLFSPFKAP